MKPIITIIGNVATGKSTILPFVVEVTGGTSVLADDFFQVSPFRDKYFSDIPRWGLTNELYLLLKRIELIESQLFVTESDKPLVIDSGIAMSWVYMRSQVIDGVISEGEWEIFQSIFTRLSRPLISHRQTILYLTSPVDTLINRIKKRGRDYELKLYTKTLLQQFERGINEFLMTGFAKQSQLITLDTEPISKLLEQNDRNAILAIVKEKLGVDPPKADG